MTTYSRRGWRLVTCVLLAGCGSPAYRVGAPVADCDGAGTAAEPARALLRVGCGGELLPGRATWSVEGGVVTLEFGVAGEAPGEFAAPVGSALVRTWPPLDEPPWLGHSVKGVVVDGDRVQVEFAEGADEPARLFADLRLSGVRLPVTGGDARDSIDAGHAEVVTRHDASIEYARSLGWDVRRIAWDRLYLAVFVRDADPARSRMLAGRVARDWVGWGAPGARRVPTRQWASIRARCGGRDRVAAAMTDVQPGSAAARSTVSYPDGDPGARQAAERLVSAAMRGGDEAAVMAELAGTAGRLAVRAKGGESPLRATSDVAAVVVAYAGPGHPCSLYAEVLRALDGWRVADGVQDTRVLLLGEAATFAVAKEDL